MEQKPIRCENNEDEPRTYFGSKILFILFVIIYIYWFAWGVTQLVVGIVYVDDCEDVQMIPIFLIVNGFTCIPFAMGLLPFYKYKASSESSKQNAKILLIVGLVIYLGWTTTGCIFVYSNNDDKVVCNQIVQNFGNAALGLNWGTMGIWGQLVFRALCVNRC